MPALPARMTVIAIRATTAGSPEKCDARRLGADVAVNHESEDFITVGKVRPLIERTFPLGEAAAAHACMETSAHIGKIVLVV